MSGPNLSLQPRQSLAFDSIATEILYGGAAGAGKSHLMRVCAIAWCVMIPGLKVGLFRRLFPDLVANHLEGPGSFYALLAPWIVSGHVTITTKQIRFWNGSIINLHHCQHEKDVVKYAGAEFHVILFDELTHFTEYQYRFIRGRLRASAGLVIPPHLRGRFPRIVSGANPGNVGHIWVKETFVDQGEMIIKKTSREEGGMTRQFIPGKLSDNKALTDSDPNYESRLAGLGDAVLVRALMDGDWDVAAGAMYGEVWRKHLHTCAPFAIPIDWDIWMGADDGYDSPAAVYWLTQEPEILTYYVIAELHQAKMLPGYMAERIKAISKNIPRRISPSRVEPHGEQVIKGLLDSAAFADTGTGGIPRGNQLVQLGVKFEPVEKWPESRRHRAQNLHKVLAPNPKDAKGLPGLRIFDTCTQIIKTLPALQRDKLDPEKVSKEGGNDHGYDGMTYGLQREKKIFGKMRMGV